MSSKSYTTNYWLGMHTAVLLVVYVNADIFWARKGRIIQFLVGLLLCKRGLTLPIIPIDLGQWQTLTDLFPEEQNFFPMDVLGQSKRLIGNYIIWNKTKLKIFVAGAQQALAIHICGHLSCCKIKRCIGATLTIYYKLNTMNYTSYLSKGIQKFMHSNLRKVYSLLWCQ